MTKGEWGWLLATSSAAYPPITAAKMIFQGPLLPAHKAMPAEGMPNSDGSPVLVLAGRHNRGFTLDYIQKAGLKHCDLSEAEMNAAVRQLIKLQHASTASETEALLELCRQQDRWIDDNLLKGWQDKLNAATPSARQELGKISFTPNLVFKGTLPDATRHTNDSVSVRNSPRHSNGVS